MNINQVIHTIQGEGKNLGVPSLLIRTQGCNLKCSFCDTKYSINNKETNINLQKEINYYISKYIFNNIIITGGEPFLQIIELMNELSGYNKLENKNIEIETNGTLITQENAYVLSDSKFKSITLNISPKFDIESYSNTNHKILNLHDILLEYQKNLQILYDFKIDFIIKFIYEHSKYENTILQFIRNNRLKEKNIPIYVMTKTENNEMDFERCLKTVEFCKRYNLIYTPRIHLPLFKKDITESI